MRIKSLRISLFVLALSLTLSSGAQDNLALMRIAALSAKTGDYHEGYAESKCDNDFSYHSLRNDITASMLVRCTDGNMSAEWATGPVPIDFSGNQAGFLWMASVDLASEDHGYDVFINDIKRFQVSSGTQGSWEYESEDGGKIGFTFISEDMHNDAMGYMSLQAPASWLTPGEPLRIKITGQAEGSDGWIIIFKAPDALSYLQTSVKYNAWVTLQEKGERSRLTALVEGSPNLAGRELLLTIGRKVIPLKLVNEGDKAKGTVDLTGPLSKSNIILLTDEYGQLLSADPSSLGATTSKLEEKYSLQISGRKSPDGLLQLSAVRSYRPKTTAVLSRLAESSLSGGRIYLMVSSHQDIAWMDSPEKCIIERDTMLLTPLFRRMAADRTYKFDVENALLLREYVQRHPESREMIRQLLYNGQLSCGSSYIQPYEEMYSGEALVRQFYFGALWLKKEFGYKPDTYFNQDVPGRTLQMPQILKKSGTDFMSVSRMEAGLYKWYSPDGSWVLTYSPGHYSEAFRSLAGDFYDAAEYIADASLRWNRYFDKSSPQPAVPVLSSWDMSPPIDYSELINRWNTQWQVAGPDGRYRSLTVPPLTPSLASQFMREALKNASSIPSVRGERPDIWLYIHGPTHHKAIRASREGDILLTAAEKFATANALADNSFVNYPEDMLRRAWEAKIYPDHGWGGKHGDITDALFQEKYYYARSEAEKILDLTLRDISSKIKWESVKGISVVVFNSLNWERNDPATFKAVFEKGWGKNISLADSRGNETQVQLSEVVRYDDGSLRSAKVCFLAEGVPSIGYKTYYMKPSSEEIDLSNAGDKNFFENEYYRVKFADGGLSSVFDKELNQELIDTGKFRAGEVFTMRSIGTGAGEFSDVQQPDMEGFDQASNYPGSWKEAESGDVYSMFVNRQPVRNAVIEQKILLYNKLKRIDFIISLLNYEGVLYREYRMALPLRMDDGKVSYEVPFGIVTVGRDEIEGAAGERYNTICSTIHPRGIENWIGADNDKMGVTLSSSVAVADYIDPTDNPSGNIILQPLLLASRRSCHGEGNEYLQTGDHRFEFSLTSHAPGREQGYRFGRQANEKLMVIAGAKQYSDAVLPEELSFFRLDNDQNNLAISTIKKAEEGSGVIVRLFDFGGKESSAALRSFRPFTSGSSTNLVEEIIAPLSVKEGAVSISVGKYSIETLLVK